MPHDHDDARNSRGVTSHRRQLIAGTAGVDLETPFGTLRISNVPLFKRSDKGLKQAIRVRVPGGVPGFFTLRLSQGAEQFDEQVVELDARPQSVLLLMPETSTDETVVVEVLEGGHLVATTPFEVTPQRRWTVHLIHQSHYDIGYTDPQSVVMESQLSFIDGALELCDLTDDWADDAKFRWNIEVTWPLKQWLKTRPAWAREALVRRVNEGRIEIHALPFSMHTEAYSYDELAHQLEFAQELRRDLGVEIVSAMQTDVPGATIGLASLLTDAGVKYFSVAHNYAGRSVPFLTDGQELERPFYWQAPDGEKLLVWYTDSLQGIAYMEGMVLGFGDEYDDVLGSLPEYLNAQAQRAYPYGDSNDWLAGNLSGIELTKKPYPHDVLHMRIQGAFADNASPSLVPSEITRIWNEEWEFPRLRLSLDRDFFEDVEQRLGDNLPTYQGDWTDWWADGIGSGAIALGVNRQSQSDLRTAQTLHAIADAVTDLPKPQIADEVERTYEDMALFDEHTWGAANPWNSGAIAFDSGAHQWIRKAAFAYSASERATSLLNGGLRRISSLGLGSVRKSGGQPLVVFNPSSWARTDLVRVFVPERSVIAPDFELIDSVSGERIPAIFEAQTNPNHRPRGRFIRFLARDVPPVGYARYELVPSDSASKGLPVSAGAEMANDALSLAIDLPTASIKSLIDQATGQNLVAEGPFGFNGYIYDRYASAPGFNHLSSRIGGSGPWLLGSRSTGEYGLITSRESNEVWERLTVRFSGDGADWLESTFTLPHGVSRLHIQNRLHKPSTMAKESVYFAFPFAADVESLAFEITGGVATQTSPHVPGSARHFRAIRHWATLDSDGGSPIAWATTEAPLVQVGNIHTPYAPFATTIHEADVHPATIYSWALNNIWDTNFPPEQGGEMTFSYTIATGGDAAALGPDTGASASQPLIGVIAPLSGESVEDATARGSFVTVDNPAVEVNHLASWGYGSGFAIYLESHADEVVDVVLTIEHLPVTSAQVGSFLRDRLEPATVNGNEISVRIAPGELKAVLVG
jgi:hypothetical protein